MTTEAASPSHPGHGTKAYRAYVLFALLIVYTFEVIDRILVALVQERIKADLQLTDLQLGLLGGTAFAVLYSLVGIPIARFAERGNRIAIISAGAAIWSAATAACGFAHNYVQLLLARFFVGIGEAALLPPAHSVISDYFPSARRTSAMAVFGLAIPIGTLFASIWGGWMAQNWDWRVVFWVLGAPGIAAAALLIFTVKEPPRSASIEETPTFAQAFKSLSKKASFWHVAFGSALVSTFAYALTQFLVSYLVRNFQVPLSTAALAFGVITAFAVGLGMLGGGFLSDRLGKRHPRVLTWLPAIGLALAAPAYYFAFIQTTFQATVMLLLVGPIFHYLYFAPMFTIAQSVAQPRERATAAALLVLVMTLLGYGLGPPLVGAAADYFAAQQLAQVGLSPDMCTPASPVAACAEASAKGLKVALTSSVALLLWGALHFWLAGRTFVRDRVS